MLVTNVVKVKSFKVPRYVANLRVGDKFGGAFILVSNQIRSTPILDLVEFVTETK